MSAVLRTMNTRHHSSRRNKVEVVLHIVWSTHERMPLVTEELERPLYRCMQSEAAQLGCTVLALGGMPDHVHMVVAIPTTVSIAKLMKQVKGVSSKLASDLTAQRSFFSWDDNYAVFSMSQPHCQRAIAYVQRQKEHHAQNNTWSHWEETDQESPQSKTQSRSDFPAAGL